MIACRSSIINNRRHSEVKRFSPGRVLALTLFFAGSCAPVSADITFYVTFDDPGAVYAAYYTDIRSNVLAAGNNWASHIFSTTPSSLQVVVDFRNTGPTAAGGSLTSSYVTTINGINTYEQGAAAEIRTGTDPNGASSDIGFTINANYLQNELWFDPNPTLRTTPVPTTRTDAESVFLHEFGHAFAFNGWRDSTTGQLPGNYQSTFDSQVFFDGSNLYFNGSHAAALYGGPVPLTYGNATHVGNFAPRPGSNLVPDLMNGVVFYRGTRYNISALDLAMAQDSGIAIRPAAVPEPNLHLLFGGGLMLLGATGALRRRNKQ